MTEAELADKLREIRSNHKSLGLNAKPAAMHLFGLVFAPQISKLGPGAAKRLAAIIERRGYETEIKNMLELSSYVTVNTSIRRRFEEAVTLHNVALGNSFGSGQNGPFRGLR